MGAGGDTNLVISARGAGRIQHARLSLDPSGVLARRSAILAN